MIFTSLTTDTVTLIYTAIITGFVVFLFMVFIDIIISKNKGRIIK